MSARPRPTIEARFTLAYLCEPFPTFRVPIARLPRRMAYAQYFHLLRRQPEASPRVLASIVRAVVRWHSLAWLAAWYAALAEGMAA